MTPGSPGAREAFRALVRQHGSDSTAEQTLNAGMRHWLLPGPTAAAATAGVAYAVGRAPGRRLWIAAGGPVGPPERHTEVLTAFENAAREAGAVPAWFGVGAATARALGPGHAALIVGAEPVWRPDRWAETVAGHASLRAQVRRAARRGVAVAEEDARAVARDPDVAGVLRFWLSTRGMPPLGFLADPMILAAVGDRRAFVARLAGRAVGVLWLAPVPARRGWLAEWTWRGPGAPNGVTDGLVDAAVRTVAAEGAERVTLGLVPLSTHAPPSDPAPPAAVRLLLAWTRAHARRFYSFDGLERFKAKFRPDHWEPLWFIAAGDRIGLRTVYALADVFSGTRGPARLVGRALADAARAEIFGDADSRTQAPGSHRWPSV